MKRLPQVGMLPDGRRLHLHDGPIDLVIQAFGTAATIAAAYQAAVRRFDGLLDELCSELVALRSPTTTAKIAAQDGAPGHHRLKGVVARRMHRAVAPFAAATFITPMAAVAGAVADQILGAMTAAADLDRAYVNNGGDIAVHCRGGQRLVVGLVDRPDRPSLFGRVAIDGRDAIRGIATSGWRGRSFSLGIADAVTVLARCAAEADAAATVIANAVDLPDHPAVSRAPARSIQLDSDLGDRLVTRGVQRLQAADRNAALRSGRQRAEQLLARELIIGAALHLQGETRVIGARAAREAVAIPQTSRLELTANA